MSIQKWLLNNTNSLAGKTVAISGATGGIGSVLCEYLANLKADLICLDRNSEKSNRNIAKLKEKYPNLNAKHIKLDLTDIEAVKNVALQLNNIGIDYLILNAGAYYVPRYKCSTNYNNIFQINFISPYYLTRKLMQTIKSRGGRVVAVSSIAHNYSHINVNDIDFSGYKASSKVYGNAKRFLTFSLYGLFDNDDILSIVHPGITLTNITAHYPKLIFALIKYPMKVIFMSPRKAALNIIYGIFNGCKNNEWIGPRNFNIWGFPKKQRLHTCSFSEAKQICNITEKIYNEIKKESVFS